MISYFLKIYICTFLLKMCKIMNTTRQEIVNTAKKLFGKSGMKSTTMHDIAQTSGKGRRTLYTYFKNKNEILDAIIKEELEFVISSIKAVVAQELDPVNKFVTYVVTRMNVVREVVQRNGSLQADFFKDVIRVELVRRKLEKIEISLIENILMEGREKGVFAVRNVRQISIFAHFVMRGIDVPYIRGLFDEQGSDKDESLKRKTLTILYGLLNGERSSNVK